MSASFLKSLKHWELAKVIFSKKCLILFCKIKQSAIRLRFKIDFEDDCPMLIGFRASAPTSHSTSCNFELHSENWLPTLSDSILNVSIWKDYGIRTSQVMIEIHENIFSQMRPKKIFLSKIGNRKAMKMEAQIHSQSVLFSLMPARHAAC